MMLKILMNQTSLLKWIFTRIDIFGHKCLYIVRKGKVSGGFWICKRSFYVFFLIFDLFFTFSITFTAIFFVAICIILCFDSFTWKSCAPIWYFNLVNASDAKITNTFYRIFKKNNCIRYARIKTSWMLHIILCSFFRGFFFYWFVSDLVVNGL